MTKSPDPKYLEFLAACIAECDREHSSEELKYAAELLARYPS